jgi:hypothetical protein
MGAGALTASPTVLVVLVVPEVPVAPVAAVDVVLDEVPTTALATFEVAVATSFIPSFTGAVISLVAFFTSTAAAVIGAATSVVAFSTSPAAAEIGAATAVTPSLIATAVLLLAFATSVPALLAADLRLDVCLLQLVEIIKNKPKIPIARRIYLSFIK